MALTALPARAGNFITEDASLAPVTALSLYSRVYYLGSSTLGDALSGVPTAITDLDDFTNLFGSSDAINLNNIELYLNNLTNGLYFVKVKPAPVATVTISNAAAGTYTVIINGVDTVVTVAANPVPTLQSVINAVKEAINNNTAINTYVEAEILYDNAGVPVYTGAFRIRSKAQNPFTLTATGANITVSAVTVPTVLNYWDYLSTIAQLIKTEAESPLGIIVCPEAFYNLTAVHERNIVGNRLENVARVHKWMAFIDPGKPSNVINSIAAKNDAFGYVASLGHSAYYYPYAADLTDNDVSPSVIAAAYAMQCYQSLGIDKPPAGSDFPLKGISKLRDTLSDGQKNDLAQAKINIITYKSGVGFVPYDTLTRSDDPRFKMISARVILNCLERSIQQSVDVSGILFQSNRARGVFYIKFRAVLENVVGVFYNAGALYGATAEDGYHVRCDESIQDNANLQNGIVKALVYAVPAGTVRQTETVVYPIQIGGIPTALTLG